MAAAEESGVKDGTGCLGVDSMSDGDDNPPSSVQKSNLNQISNRLDFVHVDGGKMAASKTEAEKRKLTHEEGLEMEEGELSTDSEFEVPRKVRRTDKIGSSECTETNSSVETNDKTVSEEAEGDSTLVESQQLTEEFHIVDDAEIDEGNDDNTNLDSDDELDDNEIYAWLEEGIEKQGQKPGSQEEEEYTEKEKVILKEKGRNPFEVLPEGWIVVTHNSGMPVYLHKQSRVCTLAKPYFLGPGSVRKHNIPVSGIPCLHYKKETEKEAMQAKEQVQENTSEPVEENGELAMKETQSGSSTGDSSANPEAEPKINPSITHNKDGIIPPTPEIKSLEKTEKENSLEPEELLQYCQKLFEFKSIKVKKFKTWKEKRKHINKMKAKERPSLPSDIKLITCDIQPADKSKAEKLRRKEYILNPVGKTALCILHEYVQHVMRVQPVYTFKELENATTPYSATVMINKVEYGTGVAASKKQAKLEAAKRALEILIPHLKLDDQKEEKKDSAFGDLSIFDEIGVEDPRVVELCNKAALLKPYQTLQECLKRNYGMGDAKVKIDKTVISNQKTDFTMTVGKHKVSVVCKNKREGKERAAQAMLQLLHPYVTSWGSILRLYSEKTMKGFKEKEEEPVTQIQSSKAASMNTEILNKLKETMRKLYERREQFASKGTLKIAYRVPQSQVKHIDL